MNARTLDSSRAAPPRAAPIQAFAVAILGIAIFSYMDAVMKDLVLAMGAYTALFWRSLAGVVLSGAVYANRSKPSWPSSAALRVHAVRGTVSTAMALCFFWGLARVPMAQAVALTFVAPLLSLFLSARILDERITRRMLIASAIALVGVIIILAGQWRADRSHEAGLGTIAILVSALCYAVNITLMRKQALVAGPIEVAFAQSLVVGVLLAIGAPFAADLPDRAHVPILLLAAGLATVSLMLMAWAYARGEASYLSSSEYTSFVWAACFGWLIFGEALSTTTLVGAALIVGGCIHAARRDATVLVSPEAAP